MLVVVLLYPLLLLLCCCSATNKQAAEAFTALHAASVAGDEAAYAAATKTLEKAIVTIFAQVGGCRTERTTGEPHRVSHRPGLSNHSAT